MAVGGSLEWPGAHLRAAGAVETGKFSGLNAAGNPATLRDLVSGEQTLVDQSSLADAIKNKLHAA
jgi:hypothetical protein